MPPDLDRRNHQDDSEQRSKIADGTSPSSQPPMKLPRIDPATIT
jgi:hypothetical protein